jgi:DNA-binding SARP family transcriptional activator/tetratricopeptide (TPR) repeat protein
MEFGLLGPLVVRHGDQVVAVQRGKQRAVLAGLLFASGRTVAVDDLAGLLWGAEPPASARVTVQNYVKRLRQALGDEGRDRIRTHPGGYSIKVARGELDVFRFEMLTATAVEAARDSAWDLAARQAGAALRLWRGEPLADAGSAELAAREVPRLTELRLQALRARLEAELHLGGHAIVIPELRQLTAAHPFREDLHALLMLALYRCGRRGEALAAYHDARGVVVSELGVEPGAELRELHQRLLADDPLLGMANEPEPPSEPVPPATPLPAAIVPRQLPGVAAHFTGRAAELAMLDQILDQADSHQPGTVVITAISGTAGVGKTALAVCWAHRVAGRFPDGQLYMNLRGYDPGQPVSAGDALAGFLRSLGMPAQDIPPEEDERAVRYRSLLAGKRMLIVLDNAGSAEQVRPLLPGSPGCFVLVTSRNVPAGLVAGDGAAVLDLEVLPRPDAITLLRTLIGERITTETAAGEELASQCCRLPLALRVAAALAAAHPMVPLSALVDELTDLRHRLNLLAASGDPRTEIRTVFSWSYRHLAAGDARVFRLLGLHPGPDFEPYATAALTGMTVPQASRALEALAHAHLIQPAETGRYGMHDLLRGYARELAASDSTDAQHNALTGLFDYYLYTAASAMDTLFPAHRHRRPRIAPPTAAVPSLDDAAAARQWLDHERAVLVAVTAHGAAQDWPGHATRLATTLAVDLCTSGHFPEALTIFGHALDAARRTGDRVAQARALVEIGSVEGEQSRFAQAAEHYRQALELYRDAGDRAGEARVLGRMGVDETRLGHHEQAARYQQEAVAIFGDIGDRLGAAHTLSNLGWLRRRQGRYQEAAGHLEQALDLFRQIGDREGEAWALTRLGTLSIGLDRYQEAAGYLQQALELFRASGDPGGEGEALAHLGKAYEGLEHYEHAAGTFEQALAISRQTDDQLLEALSLNGLGDILTQTGEPAKARAHHTTALRLASQADDPLQQARAHGGLARACQASGDMPRARQHWQEALTRYEGVGDPAAEDIRARLAMDDTTAPSPI